MNIKQRLEDWKKNTPNGEYQTVSTITLKTNSMDVSVHGNSLEEAFAQLESICKETPQTIPMTQESKSLADALGNKILVRLHTPSMPLGVGESTFEYNGTTWVVKESGR